MPFSFARYCVPLIAEPALPAAAVFDNDGLLLDTEPCWTIAGNGLFQALDLYLDACEALGVPATAAIAVPGVELPAALVAGSLADSEVLEALGLQPSPQP